MTGRDRTAALALSADERRLVNACRTADRRGRAAIVENAANIVAKYPRSGKQPVLIPVCGGVR